jgi:hypothetical protein
MIGHRFSGAVLWVLMLLCCGAGWAQGDDGFANPNESQMQLYKDGSTAFQAEQYEDAVRLFKASLVVGELNITWLNLGRAQFKLGRCLEAREAFAKVRTAPKVRNPAPEAVMVRLNEYLVDLEASCKDGISAPPEAVVCVEGKVVTVDSAAGPVRRGTARGAWGCHRPAPAATRSTSPRKTACAKATAQRSTGRTAAGKVRRGQQRRASAWAFPRRAPRAPCCAAIGA